MKIAIHTLIGHYNYGCILQAYALQTTLGKMGHQVMVINRRENRPHLKLLLQRCRSVLKDSVVRYILGNKKIAIGNPYDYFYYLRYVDFSLLKEFASRNLNYTELFRSSSALRRYAQREKFDAYVVGSDQVWREEYAPNILDSFLGYLPSDDDSIRISYAASFGTTRFPISKDKLNECIELAKKFKAISVREMSAVKLINEYLGLDAVNVLDPTFLLDAADYKELVKDNSFGCNKVVSYILDITEEKKEIVRMASTTLNVDSLNLMDYPLNEEGRQRLYSVEDWLAAISNAEFVVTDSFHGCVFSIIFNKPFIVVANRDRGIERFLSILQLLGLEERLVFSFSEAESKLDACIKTPKTDDVLSKLAVEKKKSIDFLQGYLKKQC